MAIAELWKLLQADPPGTHQFFAPATPDALNAAERSLSKWLPRSYGRFLAKSSGAVLFGAERILGIGEGLPPELDLFVQLPTLRADGMPAFLIPFGPTDDGVDCFDTRARPIDDEYPVVFWSASEGIGEASHESFDEWLFELSEALRDGPTQLEELDDDDALEDEDGEGDTANDEDDGADEDDRLSRKVSPEAEEP